VFRGSKYTPCEIQFARRFCLSADVGGYTAITADVTKGLCPGGKVQSWRPDE